MASGCGVDPTTKVPNGVFEGTQADSSGAYSIKLANGTYDVVVSKPGYVGTPASLIVTTSATQNYILTAAGITISGQVTAGGVAAKDSFVRAEKIGGGQAIGKTDTSGNYTLYVDAGTWRVFANADGYSQGSYASNPLAVSWPLLIDVSLSTAVSLVSN